MVYPALLPLMRTPRLPAVDWTDSPADLNELVRFPERPNLVSARVPSRFKRAVQQVCLALISFYCGSNLVTCTGRMSDRHHILSLPHFSNWAFFCPVLRKVSFCWLHKTCTWCPHNFVIKPCNYGFVKAACISRFFAPLERSFICIDSSCNH